MNLSSYARTSILELILTAAPWANIADNASVSPLTNLYLSLHTASPGAGGDQETNEISFTNYARVAVSRSGSAWDVTANVATTLSDIAFPIAGSSGVTATHAALGTDVSGPGNLLFFGALNENIIVEDGAAPTILTGSTITAE